MAEILLSLTIIGVVAAITLPSLTGNINERTWNTQRKALYARMSQAIALMPALNGYGTVTEESSSGAGDAVDTAAETFVTAGLSKVLKINNICDSEHLEDCGISSKLVTMNASQIEVPLTMRDLNEAMVGSYATTTDSVSLQNTKTAAFETANGESIIVYYNPNCIGSLKELPRGPGGVYVAKRICANFIYDLNGNKGPNTVGKDIGFMTALYPSDAVIVAPFPQIRPLEGTYQFKPSSSEILSASKACTNADKNYRLPNIDELISVMLNLKLLIDPSSVSDSFMSSTIIDSEWLWGVWPHLLLDDHLQTSRTLNVWCVKR